MVINKKNILIIASNGLGNSGVPRVIYNIVCSAHEKYEFDIVVFDDSDYFYPKLNKFGVNIIKCYEPKRANLFSKILWHLFKKWSYYKKIFNKLFKSKEYFAIHSFREDESWPIFKIASRHGIAKRIWHQNTITTSNKWYLSLVKKMNSKITKKYTTTFIGVSLLTCKKAFPKENYSVIYNSYNEKDFNNNIPCTLNKNCLSLTHIATYSSNKNQLFTIEVLKNLLSLYPNSALNFVGKENETGYFKLMKDKMIALGLENHIRFFPSDSIIPEIFSKTSFAILPSLSEGAPFVSIESQASGIKCFVSEAVPKEMDCGGLTFINLKNGPKEWANIILKEFKKNGNARTPYNMERFSGKSFAKSVTDLYKN